MSRETKPKSNLDKRFDLIRDREVFGYNPKESGNRAFKKLKSNRLAVIGLIFVLAIIFTSIFAPLFTKYNNIYK